MFYGNELVSCSSMRQWQLWYIFSWLPKPRIPLVLYGIRGENCPETESPSYLSFIKINPGDKNGISPINPRITSWVEVITPL